VNLEDAIPLLLVVLFISVVCLCGGMVWLVLRLRRQSSNLKQARQINRSLASFTNRRQFHPQFAARPPIWLAIRSQNPAAVQEALEMDDPTPCSWVECMDGEHTLFITPPVNGWVFVVGTGLPSPAEDVDACFRFLTGLSRKLGAVQFFQADSILHHHAWAQLEAGRVVRAYAWAGATLWNQGIKTSAEIELGLKCLAYGAEFDSNFFCGTDWPAANVEKVPLIAGRWSLDPATVGGRILAQVHGIAGKPSRQY
jgi:hypothetical protein